jgi:hypothetical protein
MSESVEKATSSGDFLIWGVMFGLLIIITVGLAIWDKKSRQE